MASSYYQLVDELTPAPPRQHSDTAAATAAVDRIYLEQLQLLHSNALLSFVATLLTSSMLCLVLWGYADYRVLTAWYVALVASTLLRYRHVYTFHRVFASARAAHRWGRTFVALTGVSAVIWGTAGVLFFPGLALQHQLFVVFILGGMGASAIAVYSPLLSAAAIFIVPVTVPVIVQMFVIGGEPLVQMGWLSVLFLVVITILARRMNAMTLQALRLGIDNKDLIDYLTDAKARTDDLNRTLELEVAERKKVETRLRVERDFISAVLDTETALVVVMNWDGSIARTNRICETVTGYGFDEMENRYVWDFCPDPQERASFKALVADLTPGTFPRQIESRLLTRAGEFISVRWSITAIFNPDGSPGYIIGTGLDQTAWKYAAWALNETREDFRALVEGVKSYAMYMLDPDGHIINWNAGTERLIGYRGDEVIGNHYSCLNGGVINRSADEAASALIEGRLEYEGWHARKDNTRFWATVVTTPLWNEDGTRRGYSVIVGDITERKQSEDTVRSLLQISADLNATLDLDELMDAIVRESLLLIGAQGGYSGLAVHGGLACHRYVKEHSVQPFDYFFRAGHGLAGLVLLRHAPYVANDALTDPHVVAELREKLAIESAIAIPILDYRNEVIGFFELHNKEDGIDFTAADQEKLVAISQAASLAIQNASAFAKIRRAEGLLTEETRVLEMVAKDAPLEIVLKLLISAIEGHCIKASCCLLLPDEATNRIQQVIAVNMPLEVWKPLVGMPMTNFIVARSPDAADGEPVNIVEVEADAARTLWSSQINSHDGRVLGIFAVLCRDRRRPDAYEQELIEKATHLAGIAVERKRSVEDLRLRDRAIDSSINAILIVEMLGHEQVILYANPAVQAVLGYPAAEIIGVDWLFWLRGVDQSYERELLRGAVREAREEHVIVRHMRREGVPAWSEIFIAPVRADAQETESSVIVMNDITDRMTAELEVKQSREQLRELSKHLQTIREEEKAQIAREIHDELGSTLTKLKMDIAWLSRRIGSDAEPVREMSATMLGLVDSAITTTRRIATNLRPPILDDLGLCAAIEWQANDFQKRLGIKCRLDLAPDVEGLGSEHSIALFRIFQEAFTNIARHAQASRVDVSLNRENGSVILKIRDDGVGIGEKAGGYTGSSGVYGMYERAKSLCGSMVLDGEAGKGTTLTVVLPLPESSGSTA